MKYKYTQPQLPKSLETLEAPQVPDSAILENAEITSLAWPAQIIKRLSVETIRLTQPDLTSSQLRDSTWTDVEMAGGQLGGLDIKGSGWRRTYIRTARMSGVNFAEAELKDVTFEDAKLNLANFRHAKLTRVQFLRCHLDESSFSGARLTDVTFTNCDMTSVEFEGARLKQTDLRSSHLEGVLGIAGLAGATITTEQMIGLLPQLASHFEIDVRND